MINEINSKYGYLPPEILIHIFSFLDLSDLFNTALVNHNWRQVSYDKSLYPAEVISSKKWKELKLGDAGEELHLPLKLFQFYKKEEHILAFIPARFKLESGSTPNILNQIITMSNKTQGAEYCPLVPSTYDKKEVNAHWALFKKIKTLSINQAIARITETMQQAV